MTFAEEIRKEFPTLTWDEIWCPGPEDYFDDEDDMRKAYFEMNTEEEA